MNHISQPDTLQRQMLAGSVTAAPQASGAIEPDARHPLPAELCRQEQ